MLDRAAAGPAVTERRFRRERFGGSAGGPAQAVVMLNHFSVLLSFAALTVTSACDNPPPDTEPNITRTDAVQAPVGSFALDHVAVDVTDDTATVLAFDAEGQVIGEFAVFDPGDGIIITTATFSDGHLAAEIDAATNEVLGVQIERIEPAEVKQRAALAEAVIAAAAADDPVAFEGWSGCALTVLATVASCSPAGWWVPIACGVAGVTASCTCLNAATDGKTKPPCGKDKEKKK